MDLDTLINVGSYCERTLCDPMFQWLSASFEQEAVNELLATKPHELKTRETIYSRISAHREFLSNMARYVEQKNEALEPTEIDQIDDPSVHNFDRED